MAEQLCIGDRVMVYEDPLTREREEGAARVVRVLKNCRDQWYCDVHFDIDDESETYPRFIGKPVEEGNRDGNQASANG